MGEDGAAQGGGGWGGPGGEDGGPRAGADGGAQGWGGWGDPGGEDGGPDCRAATRHPQERSDCRRQWRRTGSTKTLHQGLMSASGPFQGPKSHRTQSGCAVFSRVRVFSTPWTAACQAPLSMGFSRQEYWSGLPFPPPEESSRPKDLTCISCVSCIGRRVL